MSDCGLLQVDSAFGVKLSSVLWKFLVKMTGWISLHSHLHHILLLRPTCSACYTDSPEKCSLSSSVSAVHDLKNLYCCDIPDSMMDRDLLLSHFEQFGHVVRIYLSVKRKSCTLHFDSHVSMFVVGSS